MNTILSIGRRTFASLAIRNYRLYFIGQAVSLSGTWMQTVAQGWLVLQLTGSGVQLGAVVAIQFLPMLLIGPFGGVIVDSFDKRRILIWTQALFGVLAFIISALVFTGLVELWMVYVFVTVFGIVRVFDQPARQTFVSELVDEQHLRNAVSLNSTENNLARAVGPTIAGVLIAGVGIAFCFLINAVSYLFVIYMLLKLRKRELHRPKLAPRTPGQLVAGFRYVAASPFLRNTLIMMAVIGTFAYEFQVSLPLMAERVFSGDASSYAALLAAMGIGSVVGGLFAASRQAVIHHQMIAYVALFGVALIATATMPTLSFAILGMLFVGFFSINVTALGQTMMQLESVPEMRGRVMALWSTGMIGSTAIGGPIVGLVGEYFGARWGLAIGGIATLAAVLVVSAPLVKRATVRFISEEVEHERDKAANEHVTLS